MAKFLNSSGVTFHLEELIKNARERLVLISPFLKFNDRMRELLEDKDRLKIDVRIIYGKNELHPEEINWLRALQFVRTSFCKNLHAKCYMNESMAIITSMNLYEFSQVNNNEMGVLIGRADGDLFQDAYDEAQRLIRISDEIKISMEKVPDAAKPGDAPEASDMNASPAEENGGRTISTTQLAKKMNIPGRELFSTFLQLGYIERVDNSWKLTPLGSQKGGVLRTHPKHGDYIAWPESMEIK